MTEQPVSHSTEKGPLRWVIALFLIAALLRAGWVVVHFGPRDRAEHCDYPDEDAYVLGGRSLAAGHGLIDEFGYRATYMPGYPAFIAIFQSLPRPLLWTRLAQAVAAAWVAPATFLLARRFQRVVRENSSGRAGPSASESGTTAATWLIPVLAGLAAAFDPFLLFFSGLLLTEALFAASLVTAWLFVLPLAERAGLDVRDATGYGLLAGLSLLIGILLRPSSAALLLAIPVLVLLIRRLDKASWVYGLVLVSVVAAGLSPWAVRNLVVLGEWRWLTTRGGISLYDGLQQGATGESDLAHTKTAAEVKGLDELAWDRHFHQLASSAIQADPRRVAWLAGRKFLRTWSLTPNETHYHTGPIATVSAAWMLLILILAAIGTWHARRALQAWVLLLLPVAVFTAIHMLYVGSVRYRVPEMPFMMVLASVGCGVFLQARPLTPRPQLR